MIDKIYKISVITFTILLTLLFFIKFFEPTHLKAQNSDLEFEIDYLKSQMFSMQSEIRSLKNEVKEAGNSFNMSLSGLPGRINQIEDEIQYLKSEIYNCKNDIQSLESKVEF